MRMYSDPERENDKWALPDIEVWEEDGKYYWWYCFPGCMPESEQFGPFESEAEALENIEEMNGD